MLSIKHSFYIATLIVAASIIVAPVANSLFGEQPMRSNMQNTLRPSPATLYVHPNCPHCHKVTNYLQQMNKTIAIKDISNPQYKQEFQSYGQSGVPVLVVGSQIISGADQIVKYLKEHPEVLR
jgi:glutaredoxin